MSVFCVFVLGIVQGLSEFLPISSSGHLILVQKLFGVEPDLFTNVAMHFGTLFAVILFYKKQVWGMVKHPLSKKTILVFVATLPTVVIGFAIKLFLPSFLDGAILPIGFAFTIVLLFASDLATKQKHNLMTLPKTNAFWVGVVQGISVLPGLSRSGATICTAKMLGTKSEGATELSFLMSIPVILGSILLTLVDVLQTQAQINWLAISVGVVTSFVVGYFSLGFLAKIAKGSLKGFGYYMFFPFLLSCVLY